MGYHLYDTPEARHELERERKSRLRAANEVRTKRAKLKKHLGSGSVSLSYALLTLSKPWMETVKLRDLLVAVPGIGEHTAAQALFDAGMPFDVELKAVSHERREGLLLSLQRRRSKLELGIAKGLAAKEPQRALRMNDLQA